MANIVKSVENFRLSVTSTDTTFSGILSKGQNYENCVPFVTCSTESDAYSQIFVDVYFGGTTTSGIVYFERYAGHATYPINVSCSVVEFEPTEIRVQSGTFSASNTPDVVTVSGFDQTKTAMVFYYKTSIDYLAYQILVRGRVLSNGTQVDFYKYNVNGSSTGHFYIFEDLNDNFNVEHTDTNTNNNFVLPLSDNFFGRQILLFSWANSNSSTGYTYRYTWYANTAPGSFIRFNLFSPGFNSYLNTQVLTFTGNKIYNLSDKVYDNYIAPPYTSDVDDSLKTTFSGVFSETVDYSELSAISSAPFGMGGGVTSVAATNSDTFFEIKIDDVTETITLERATAVYGSYPPAFSIIDWNGRTTISGTNSYTLDSDTTFVRSTEAGEISLAVGQVSKVCVLKGDQDISNSIVFKSYSSPGTDINGHSYLLEAYFDSPNKIWFRRAASLSELDVSFSVVEFYPDQVEVTHGEYAFDNSGSSKSTTISGGVTFDKTFLISSYSAYTTGAYFDSTLIRTALDDANTISFYRYKSNNTLYPAHISYSLVEDIAGDNFYVDNKNFSGTDMLFRQYTTHSFKPESTIFFNSYAGSFRGDDGDDSLFSAFYHEDSMPVEVGKYVAGYNSYVYSAAVHIIRSNRKYVQTYYELLSSYPYDETVNVVDEFTTFSGSLSLLGTSLNGWFKTNSSAGNAFYGSLFKGTLNEIDMTFNIKIDVSVSYNLYPSFLLVNWLGYGDYTYDFNTTKTGSLVESIETATISGTAQIFTYNLKYGQDITKCVPFATWWTDNQVGSANQFFRFNFYNDPKQMLMYSNLDNDVYVDANVHIVEFRSNTRVQSGSACMEYNDNSLTVTLDNSVVKENSFLIYYYNSTPEYISADWAATCVAGHISSSTELDFYRYSVSRNNSIFITYYVVECFNGEWAVEHGTDETGYTLSDKTYPVSDLMARTNSIITGSYDASCGSYQADDCLFIIKPAFVDHMLHFIKNTAGYNSYHRYYQIITFSDENIFVDFYSGATSVTALYEQTLGVPIDVNRSIIFNGGLMNLNKTNLSSTANQYTHFKYSIVDSENVKAERYSGASSYNNELFYHVISFPEYNAYRISGNVYEENVPVSRQVRAYRSDTGAIMASTTSSGTTGYFELATSYSGAHYVVCLDDTGQPDFNDLIYGKIYPTVISGCFPDLMGWV